MEFRPRSPAVGLASALGFVSGEDKQEKTTVITLAGGSAGQQWCSVRRRCFDALVPGGRLICVVGDVCLSRRKNNGRHTVVPLHASIQERCRAIGYDNLAPIIWHKIANAVYEVDNGSAFLGKPYEPNSVVKNDIEFILMQRKPGGYRKPSVATRVLSVISAENHVLAVTKLASDVTPLTERRLLSEALNARIAMGARSLPPEEIALLDDAADLVASVRKELQSFQLGSN